MDKKIHERYKEVVDQKSDNEEAKYKKHTMMRELDKLIDETQIKRDHWKFFENSIEEKKPILQKILEKVK